MFSCSLWHLSANALDIVEGLWRDLEDNCVRIWCKSDAAVNLGVWVGTLLAHLEVNFARLLELPGSIL